MTLLWCNRPYGEVDVEVDVAVPEPDPLPPVPLADTPLLAVARPTVMPIRAAPATIMMPLLPSRNCALCTPAGLPGASGARPVSAKACDAVSINPNVKTVANFIYTSSRAPQLGKPGNRCAFRNRRLK